MHLMIDLETLGVDPVTAPILQVAAVPFELDGSGPSSGREFQAFATLASNLEPPFNRDVEAGTLAWWLNQNLTLFRQIVIEPRGLPLTEVLHELGAYISSRELEGIWANGPTFDLAMLAAAYKQCGLSLPWSFRAERCFRTMGMLAGDDHACWDGGTKTERETIGQAHDARVDCDRQIRLVQQVMALKTHG